MRIDSVILRDVGPFDDVRIDLPEGTNSQLADVYQGSAADRADVDDLAYKLAAHSAALEPAPGITEGDLHRALQTIAILELNRTDARRARLTAVKAIARRVSDDELADVPYRFLISLVTA
jgi:hypothetical protein